MPVIVAGLPFVTASTAVAVEHVTSVVVAFGFSAVRHLLVGTFDLGANRS